MSVRIKRIEYNEQALEDEHMEEDYIRQVIGECYEKVKDVVDAMVRNRNREVVVSAYYWDVSTQFFLSRTGVINFQVVKIKRPDLDDWSYEGEWYIALLLASGDIDIL